MAATPAYSGPEPAAPVSPIFGVSVPEGYRDWTLVGVAQETGDLDELRAVLANPAALKSYRAGTLPFPDGSALVKLAWRRQQSPEFTPAFVPGGPTTIQVMVKDQARFQPRVAGASVALSAANPQTRHSIAPASPATAQLSGTTTSFSPASHRSRRRQMLMPESWKGGHEQPGAAWVESSSNPPVRVRSRVSISGVVDRSVGVRPS
jgi:hypothetical protein